MLSRSVCGFCVAAVSVLLLFSGRVCFLLFRLSVFLFALLLVMFRFNLNKLQVNGLVPKGLGLVGGEVGPQDRKAAVLDYFENHMIFPMLAAGATVILGTDGTGIEHSDLVPQYGLAFEIISGVVERCLRHQESHVALAGLGSDNPLLPACVLLQQATLLDSTNRRKIPQQFMDRLIHYGWAHTKAVFEQVTSADVVLGPVPRPSHEREEQLGLDRIIRVMPGARPHRPISDILPHPDYAHAHDAAAAADVALTHSSVLDVPAPVVRVPVRVPVPVPDASAALGVVPPPRAPLSVPLPRSRQLGQLPG